jgi:signal transduction histidine kinase
MPDKDTFPRLVSLAAHDLSTPLATVYGFARTLARADLQAPADRYVEMIEAASRQLDDLIKQLGLVARIEGGRFEPALVEVDSLELARSAVAELEEERVEVSGQGVLVQVPEEDMRRGLSQLIRAAGRYGGFDVVAVNVDGPKVAISPVSDASAPVLLGEELRELGAAAATWLIRALGGSVDVEGELLVIRLSA